MSGGHALEGRRVMLRKSPALSPLPWQSSGKDLATAQKNMNLKTCLLAAAFIWGLRVPPATAEIFRDHFNRPEMDLRAAPNWAVADGAYYGYLTRQGRAVSVYAPLVGAGAISQHQYGTTKRTWIGTTGARASPPLSTHTPRGLTQKRQGRLAQGRMWRQPVRHMKPLSRRRVTHSVTWRTYPPAHSGEPCFS